MPAPVADPSRRQVVVMTAGGLNPTVVVQHLAKTGFDVHVLLENPEGKGEITRRRARKLGWINALGQLGTMIAARLLRRLADRRVAELLDRHGLDRKLPDTIPIHPVTSINAPETVALIDAIKPGAIPARLDPPDVGKTTGSHALPGHQPACRYQPELSRPDGRLLVPSGKRRREFRYHPASRRCRHGYRWHAPRSPHPAPERSDFISTYPLLLTIASFDIVRQSLEDALAGRLAPKTPEGPSALRFPPTLWSWIWCGMTRRIW
jgi:hypothetical protein